MVFAGIPGWAVGLLLAGCAAALVVLHLLRVRPRRVRVVTTLFWARAAQRTRARTLLRRFRHPLTCALLVASAALLVLALGRPQRPPDDARRQWLVLALDGGLSMAALHGDGTRWDAAVRAALRAAATLHPDDRVAVVVADPRPRLVHAFDQPAALLPHRLRACRPAAASADRAGALRLAQSLVAGRPQRRILLLTDRPLATDHPDARPADDAVEVVPVGAAAANAAILAALFEPDAADPLRGRLIVRAGCWGSAPRDLTLIVRAGAPEPLLRAGQRIAPGATHDFRLADVPADGSTLELELMPDDDLPADNRLALRLPRRAPIRARLAPSTPPPLRVLFESDPAVLVVADDAAHDLDVLTGALPPELTRPAVIVVEGGPPVAAGAALEIDADSPLARGLAFDGRCAARGTALPAVPPLEPLARTAAGQPLAAHGTLAGRPVLLLAPALLSEDAAACRHPAFAALLLRAVRRVAGWEDEPLVWPAARAATDPLWPARRGHGGPLVSVSGSRADSDLARTPPVEPPVGAPPGRRRPAAFELLLAAALALLLVEAALHARGRIP